MDNKKTTNAYPASFMVLVFLVAAIIASIAKRYLNSNASWGAAACAVALMIAAKTRWKFKGDWWFWGALGLGALVQLPLVFLMPWANRYLTGTGAMAFVIPGFLMAYGILFLAEKIFANSSPK